MERGEGGSEDREGGNVQERGMKAEQNKKQEVRD